MAKLLQFLPRLILGLIVLLMLLGLTVLFVSFHHFRAEVVGETAGDLPFRDHATRVQAGPDGHPPLLTPDPAALRSGAIACRRLETVRYQPSVSAIGEAIDPVDLSETRNALAAAQTAFDQANGALAQARSGTGPPQDDSGNADEAAPRASPDLGDVQPQDENAAQAAFDLVALRRAVALALYGPTLADWMQSGSTALDPVLKQRASLLLLTPLPGGVASSLPQEAAVTDRFGAAADAHLVSVVFRIDPRLQTISGVYRTDDQPGRARFVPGPAVSARLLTGPACSGATAPAAAVLQHGGKSWVYVEEAPGQFRRREVSVDCALPDGSGWFQDRALQAGENVVTRGGALLLAEER